MWMRGEAAEGVGRGAGFCASWLCGWWEGTVPADTLCFIFQGTLLLWVPRKGLYLFAVFYTFGNIASIGR